MLTAQIHLAWSSSYPTPHTHLAHVQLLLLEVLLVLLQELLVLLLDYQVLQRLCALWQRCRLRAPQWAVLPQLVHGWGYAVCADQGLCVQGQSTQTWKTPV